MKYIRTPYGIEGVYSPYYERKKRAKKRLTIVALVTLAALICLCAL